VARIICFFLFLNLANLTFGQVYDGTYKIKTKPPKAAGCAPPTSTTYLELNNVRAMIHTAGNLWQIPNQNYSQYEIPKNSGIMALFTAALWLGGTDVNNQLKLAALRYRNGQDYWTGPLTKVTAEFILQEIYGRFLIKTTPNMRSQRTLELWRCLLQPFG